MSEPLDITLGELVGRLQAPQAEHDWVNIRTEDLPWRHIVSAAKRGECEVSRVGRRLMMRRAELDKWLTARRIQAKQRKLEDKPQVETEITANVRRMLERQGYGH
jgi:hypothetical protein